MLLLLTNCLPALAQTIEIDGIVKGLCPAGSIKLNLTSISASYTAYKWETLDATGLWQAFPFKDDPFLYVTAEGSYRLKITDSGVGNLVSNTLVVPLLSPPAVVTITATPAKNQICQGESIQLSVPVNPNVEYNWTIDGVATNKSQATFTATLNGDYTVKLTDRTNLCPSISNTFRLDYTSNIQAKIAPVPVVCGLTTTPITLVGTPLGGTFSGKGITNASTGVFNPSVAGTGSHTVKYSYAVTGSCPESVDEKIIIVADPKPIITSHNGKADFCTGDAVSLSTATGMASYEWKRNGIPVGGSTDLININNSGDFAVKVSDINGCGNSSPIFTVKFFGSVAPSIGLIPSVCGTSSTPVTLNGSPAGGIFSIDGSPATVFDYAKLGFGKHSVVYNINGVLSCLSGTAQQEVIIQQPPQLNLVESILLGKGNKTILRGFIGNEYTYEWSPMIGLDNPFSANPEASPTATADYVLTVKSTIDATCQTKDTTSVVIFEPVYVPSAFSPNQDGDNDTWVLRGLNAYPDAEVQVFNRWGVLVHYSKGIYNPFDGKLQGKDLEQGTYIYTVKPFPNRPELQYNGTLTLFR